jgi:phosphoribosylanthranilate isomerase
MPQVVKAFRLKDASSLLPIKRYHGQVRALLLDTYQQGVKGGTGKAFDWKLVANNIREFDMPVILSGGLTPSNVQAAVSVVKPYAIDVNSGVEDQPGKKSSILMKELFNVVRRINREGVADD